MKFVYCIFAALAISASCFAQALPENAVRNPYTQGWDCAKGYYKSGQNCVKVQLPENARLNYVGNGWECNRGYYKSGQSCHKVELPPNAQLNYLGNGWECQKGFYRSGQQCLVVNIPENAALNYFGNGWECIRGYYRAGQTCSKVQVPPNASMNYFGNGWECNKGFKKSANSCIAMSAQELQKQKEFEQLIAAKVRARQAMAVSGDDCESEFKTNAEVCVEIEKANLECNEDSFGGYYRDCEAILSYEVRTNYQGNSQLDVEVECKVEIEYSGKGTFSTQSDYSRKDESHSLFAHGSDSERMRFDFSFSSFKEINRVKISSAKCEIDSVNLM